MADKLRESALEYHRLPTPGKLAIVATKPLANQRDLALAYSPGVAAACEAIVEDPGQAAQLTARGNLVGVITNGTAVLGLGSIGPLAAKPVMEGKAVLFKTFAKVRLVASGAGAAALACLDLLVDLGLPMAHITVTDIAGVVYEGREELMDERKARYAKKTSDRRLADVIEGADIFLGLSAPGVLKPEMVKKMAADPLVFALANPVPEILPEEVRAVRPDAVIATGRSDYPNQ